MTYRMFQVDAFAQKPFEGNPAAVLKLDAFLPDDLMQQIAMENNLSETAFVVPTGEAGHFDLRWFTPTDEIDFCGHATVATAHVLATEYNLDSPFYFHAKVGGLIVTTADGKYVLDAPAYDIRPAVVTDAVKAAFPVPIDTAFWGGTNLFIVFENAEDVRAAAPDLAQIKTLSDDGVGITAKGDGAFDFTSRYFAPLFGIDEDPATGSIHAALGPYWAKRLNKTFLTARQASPRGATLWLDVGPERVKIAGQAVTVMRGDLFL